MPILFIDRTGRTRYRWGPMKTRREETGDVTNSILDKYQILIEETVPAYKKRVAELESRVRKLEIENARLQPKDVRQKPKRK